MRRENNQEQPKMFYGHIIVASASFIMAITWGANRSFGVFLEPMLSDLGWTWAGISGAFTLSMIVAGFMGTITGKLTDVYTKDMWMLYIFAAIFGFSLWASGGLIPIFLKFS